MPLLRRSINGGAYLTPRTLRLDPWWDKLRGQPEVDSFVAEAEADAKRVEAETKSKP